MNRPSPAHADRARHFLTHEGAAGSTDTCATAAGRVYDELHAHLAPLVGHTGVQALFIRSIKLTRRDFPFLEDPLLDDSTKLRERLQTQDPKIANEAAVALFATFFALIATFIGERLTTQALNLAWPTLEEIALKETKK